MEPELIPSFLGNLVRLRRVLHWSRPRLERHQAKALTALRRHAAEHSPYYARVLRGLESAPLAALPSLDRTRMLEAFDDLATDRRIRLDDVRRHVQSTPPGTKYLGRYRVTTSTGSGGGAVSVVLVGAREWAYDLASTARARDLAGLPWAPWRLESTAMIVSAQRWLASSKAADSYRSRFAPQRFLDANAPIGELVRDLNAYRPSILSGYSSLIGMLAEEQLAGRLRIAPKLVTTGGEVTLPEVRRRVTAAWGHEPFDYYGTAEGGTIAAECREGRRMHLFEDTTLVEVVDDANQPVPPGTWGAKMLVTPLWLRTEPLIRFEINDVVRVSPDACRCGRPTRVLDGIRGRAPRIFTLPAAAGTGSVEVSWMGLATGTSQLPALYRSFDMVDGVFVVNLAGLSADHDLEPLRARIHAEFVAHGAVPPPIEFRILPEVPRAASGKAALATAGSS
jgi:phenylacetate-coenzyme A ligase PaaK-like adenylate-forming protein